MSSRGKGNPRRPRGRPRETTTMETRRETSSRVSSKRNRASDSAIIVDDGPPGKKRKDGSSPRIIAKRAFAREKLSEVHRLYDAEKDKEEMNLATLNVCRQRFERYRKELDGYDESIQDGLEGDDLTTDVYESEEIRDRLETSVSELISLIGGSGRNGAERDSATPLESRAGRIGADTGSATPIESRSGRRGADTCSATPLESRAGRSGADMDAATLIERRSGRIGADESSATPIESRSGRTGVGGSTEAAGRSLSGHQTESGNCSFGIGRKATPKLPKLELIKFDGNPIRYKEFWEQFESSIHKNDLADTDKFSYLKSSLIGKALDAVEGMALTSANYAVALGILKEDFGDEQAVIAAHFDAISKLSLTSTKTAALRTFYSAFEKHIRCLEALGLKRDEFSKTFVPMILGKLPQEIKLELSRKKGATTWDLATLRRLLKEEITAREDSASLEFSGSRSDTRNDRDTRKTDLPRTASTLFSNGRRGGFQQTKCGYCDGGHYSDQCRIYPDLESRKLVLGTTRCFRCLRTNHKARTCSWHLCPHCGGDHHRSLCPDKVQYSTRNRGSYGGTQQRSTTTSTSKTRASMNSANKPHQRDKPPASGAVAMLAPTQRTILQTAEVMAEAPNRKGKSICCRLICDSASDRSFITRDLADKLQLNLIGSETVHIGAFGSSTATEVTLPVTTIRVRSPHTNGSIEMTVNIMDEISVPIRKERVDIDKFRFVSAMTLAEPLKDYAEDIHLDILIGQDYYQAVIDGRRVQLDSGLYLIRSIFGWIFTGRVDSPGSDSPSVTLLAPSRGVPLAPTSVELERFWNLESIGITDTGSSTDEDYALKRVMDSMTFEKGRYSVGLPWKEPALELPDNFPLALGRLKSQQRRFAQQPNVREKYQEIIDQQLQDEMIEAAPPDSHAGERIHYLPHHGVSRIDAISTKLRIVFDASSKAGKQLNSLNDCLYPGPVLLKDLCGLLLRFRLGPIGILSDLEKAFLQIGIIESDRDALRFLWFAPDGTLRKYRFRRVPFGVNSSPFLLAATVDSHLNSDGSAVALKIRDNIYVDNVGVAVHSVEEAVQFRTAAKAIFASASMNLREWYSNDDEFMSSIPPDDRVSSNSAKLLGLTWNRVKDSLSLRNLCFEVVSPLTKRKLLAAIASVYDPLGFFSPVVIRAKCLIQTLWQTKLDWDDPLPPDLCAEWHTLAASMNDLSDLSVPRYVGLLPAMPNSSVSVEAHCFCDASTSVYAACVYLRIMYNNCIVSTLLLSKTRLAPIKSITIPRLELMAVLIGLRLVEYVKRELRLDLSATYVWSDSHCVLSWISSSKLKTTFVENRLREIRAVPDIQFRYVSTLENPADIPTRGMSASQLRHCSLWWEGPSWLQRQKSEWPIETVALPDGLSDTFETMESPKRANMLLTASKDGDEFLSLLEKGWTLQKLMRITAYVLRARDKFMKRTGEKGPPSASEVSAARRLWDSKIQDQCFSEEKRLLSKGSRNALIHQLNLYLDDDGLIRCRGRLMRAEVMEAAKDPLLLPRKHTYSARIIEDLHRRLMHSGTRHTLSELRLMYWIPSARHLIRSTIRKCTVCRKWEGGPFRPPSTPALPKERLSQAPVFTYTGVDYLGPLWIKNDLTKVRSKVWICLFTCAVTRAVHLEVAPSMLTGDFIEILRRFVARRGKPNVIISDNAKQFKVGQSIMSKIWADVCHDPAVQTYIATEGIRWKFIVEVAPWMGGFYERLVGLVKRALRKTIDNRNLTYRQLETIVIECEAVLNTRPLGFVGSEIEDAKILTPASFMGISPFMGFPEIDVDLDDPEFRVKLDTAGFLLDKWKTGQTLLNGFWTRFRNEYLLGLREYGSKRAKSGTIKELPFIGQPVLIRSDLPRGQWRLGLIETLNYGADGVARSAVIRTKGRKTLQRAVALLYPLEYSDDNIDENGE